MDLDNLSIDDPDLDDEPWGATQPEEEKFPVTAAQNEQVAAPVPSFDDMFAPQKLAQQAAAVDDPFSLLLKDTSSPADIGVHLLSTATAASPAPKSSTEVGGTGGGWGDDDDDLDIE